MVTPEGDLVVGRKEAVTAGLQRDAPWADVFVRSNRTARADVRLRLRLRCHAARRCRHWGTGATTTGTEVPSAAANRR
ncbi:MAG: hypothetical protein R3E85_05075 [Planctomycetota bacterium]